MFKKIISCFVIFTILISNSDVYAVGLGEGGGGFSGGGAGRRGSGYYTVPTISEADENGNVTNYYRSGDTSTAPLIDSAAQSFSSYQYNTYQTNNNSSYYSYQANVDLSNFLNTYTYNTVTNNYELTYNTYTYNTTNNYYNITIDASTTLNYNYDIQVEYAPSYTQVTYISNSETVNNVTNIYYYSLYDGRNSYDITVNEILGLATDYGAANYETVIEDPDTLSLQHFDGNYDDLSAYGREPYFVNRSLDYVDTGDFGQAVNLASGSIVGVTIPELTSNTALCIDFRYYGTVCPALYIGDARILSTWSGGSYYTNLYPESNSRKWNAEDEYFAYSDVYSRFNPPYDDEKFSTIYPVLDDDVTLKLNLAQDPSYDYYPIRIFGYYGFLGYVNRLNYAQWNSYRIVFADGNMSLLINGELRGTQKYVDTLAGETVYIKSTAANTMLDELRVATGSFVSISTYTPPTIPFDTNKVLALPENPEEGQIYVRSSIPVSNVRIGGVRPSNPTAGYVYIPLDSTYKGAGIQISDGVSWEDSEGYIYENETWSNVIGYRFLTVGDYDDVDSDNDGDPGGDGSGDSSGDGSNGSGSGGDGSGGALDSLADLLSIVLGGIVKLFDSVIGAILDALTSLAEMVSEKLTRVVEIVMSFFAEIPAMFSGFMGFLTAVFPFMPDDIMLLLTFGIAAVICIGIIKAVRR